MAQVQAVRDFAAGLFRMAFPDDIFRPGNPFRPPRVVKLKTFPPNAAEIGAIAAEVGRSTACELVIAADSLLSREVKLPPGARAEAAGAIALNLRQTLPGHAKGLIWRHIWKRRDSDGDVFAAYILKEEHLNGLRATAEQAGLRVASIRADVAGLPPHFVAGSTGRAVQFWRRATAAAVAVALVVSIFSSWLQARRAEAENDALRATVTALQEEAVTAKGAADSVEGAKAAVAVDLALFNDQRRLLDLLSSLAVDLPDDTWAPELALSDNRLYLAILTKAKVPDLLERLDEAPWSASVRLDGPIIPDSLTGQSRFQLVADLARTAADE